MKIFLFFAIIIFFFSCEQAEKPLSQTDAYRLSINPNVDTTLLENKQIALALSTFLATKNQSLLQNPYWASEDFDKYSYPYYDIFQLEVGKSGATSYLPTLLAILPTEKKDIKILKIGFMGSPGGSDIYLKAIYNLLAVQQNGQIQFKRVLEYNTRNWQTYQWGAITYHISPQKEFNQQEAAQQEAFIQQLCLFFNTAPIPIQYYSCMNPVELFQIRGFEFKPEMYFHDQGGQNEVWSGIIYSGSGSEKYEHEIVHTYLYEIYRQNFHRLFDEGMATYLGGSSGLPYSTHRQRVKDYWKQNPQTDLSEFLDPYQPLQINEDTSLPYMVGALICEYAYRSAGKEGLLSLFESGREKEGFWKAIEPLGMNEHNFNSKLRELLQKEIVLVFE